MHSDFYPGLLQLLVHLDVLRIVDVHFWNQQQCGRAFAKHLARCEKRACEPLITIPVGGPSCTNIKLLVPLPPGRWMAQVHAHSASTYPTRALLYCHTEQQWRLELGQQWED